MKRIAAISCVLFALVACSKTPSEPAPVEKTTATATASTSAPASSTPSAAASASAAASGSTAAGPDDLAFDAPASWQSMPNPNAMRKATYKIPKPAGDAEDAELTFSTASGGVDPNVSRWAKQFGDAKPTTEKKKVNGLDVTMVEIKGKYAGGGPAMGAAPSSAKPDWMLLGAIVDAGDKQHFFKMVGPAKTVTAAKKDFDKLVASLRAK